MLAGVRGMNPMAASPTTTEKMSASAVSMNSQLVRAMPTARYTAFESAEPVTAFGRISHGFGGVGSFTGLGLRGGMAKKPDLDEPTLRIAERMLRMPPKPHDQMKLGKPRGKPGKSPKAKKKAPPKRG
jgi:hypothetical protein